MAAKITNREAISQIKSIFKQINADTRTTNKEVYSLIKKHSLWIVKRESERLKLLRMDSFFQEKDCIEVIEAPVGDDCCQLKGKLGCTIYRTKYKLPEMYEDLYGPIINKITSIDGYTDIKLNSVKGIKRLEESRYAKKYNIDKTIQAYYSNGYLYFPGKHLKLITVDGLFTEEIDKENSDCNPCKDCEKNCVKFLDRKLMISDYLFAQVVDAIKNDLVIKEKLPEKAHSIDKSDNK